RKDCTADRNSHSKMRHGLVCGKIGEQCGSPVRMEQFIVERNGERASISGVRGLDRVVLVWGDQGISPEDQTVLRVLGVLDQAVDSAGVLPEGGNVRVVEVFHLETLIVHVDCD